MEHNTKKYYTSFAGLLSLLIVEVILMIIVIDSPKWFGPPLMGG